MRLAVLVFTLLASSIAWAADPCTDERARDAEMATDSMKTWSALYAGFKRYRGCDDGAIAEGFTEAVVHHLASDWKSLPEAAALVQKHPSFRAFFLRHIDASADTDELKKIDTLASSQCPKNLAALCSDIGKSVAQALSEAE